MKNRREAKHQKLVWEEYLPRNWSARQQLLANTWSDDHDVRHPERRVDRATVIALEELTTMAKSRKIIGLAGIALRPDGRVSLIASGNAYDDHLRASGALMKLQKLISDLNEA